MSCPFKDMLGRYEKINPDKNEKKFWACHYNKPSDSYITSWGRIGTKGQSLPGLTENEAYKKINEKISGGYIKVATEIFPLLKSRKPKKGSKVTPPRPRKAARKVKEEFNFMDELRKIK